MSDSSSQQKTSTTNTYADQRNAVQGGVGNSGNNNTIINTSVTTDDGAITGALNAATTAMTAAIQGNSTVASSAISNNSVVATNAINSVTASENQLASTGLSMLQANTSLAQSLISSVMNGAQQTQQIAANLASQQVAASNDDKYLIVAGLAVVCIVGVMAFSGKRAA